MTDLRKAAEMALEALVNFGQGNSEPAKALRQALAQPEQEPVAWMCEGDELGVWKPVVFLGNELSTHKASSAFRNWQPLYKAPLNSPEEKLYTGQDIIDVVEAVVNALEREWVGLTDEEISQIWGCLPQTMDEEQDAINFGFAIEAKLKEKNT